MNINLHIERLILDDVNLPPGQTHLLQVGLETELTRLLTEGGLAAQLSAGGALSHIVSPTIQLKSGNGPIGLGQQIAGAVYGGIGK